jgi:pyrroline-5-carboxylate reductase
MSITKSTQCLVLWGCGKMGSAMLMGWLASGWRAENIYVIDPFPSENLKELGVHINQLLPAAPDIVVVAVKPQMIDDVLPQLAQLPRETRILSVAAGLTIARFAAHRPEGAVIIRSMPNTPAAIGQGITAYVGNAAADQTDLALADALLSALGQTVALSDEGQIDAVTGLSGSGPAYVFYMIDAMAAAGVQAGLAPEVAMRLAKATVAGAGALAMHSADSPEQLRINVTSPNGTTQAGLEPLMDEGAGLGPLMQRTVAAAVARSIELGKSE